MLRLLITYLSILLCTSATVAQLPTNEPTTVQFKVLTIDQAIKLATEEGKPLFIDSYAKWCIPCKKMDAVFKDREVAKVLNDNFINVKVNMDQPYGKEYQARYGVIFLPTFLFLDFLGNKQMKIDRVLSKYELIAYANAAIGKSTFASAPTTSQPKTTAPKRTTTTTRPVATSRPPSGTTRSSTGATTRSSTGATKRPSTITTPKATQPKRSTPTRQTATKPKEEEKILHILKPEDMNPDILYQEAYMSMQMMDGSHWAYAEEYLKTQSNWSTPKNMRFVFDFVRYTHTREFNYIIKHREEFNKLVGKDNVDRSIEIIVYTRINQGIPRPDLQEAINLYRLTTVSDPTGRAYKYYIKRLLDENQTDNLLTILNDYMTLVKVKDAKILNLFGLYTAKATNKRGDLLHAVDVVSDAIRINSSEPDYWLTLAILHTKLGNNASAIKAARKSLSLTPESNKESIEYLNGLIKKNR